MTKDTTPPASRKPYRKPVLENYGAVRELTRAIVGTAPMNDSMSSATTKTG